MRILHGGDDDWTPAAKMPGWPVRVDWSTDERHVVSDAGRAYGAGTERLLV
jgi:hypothetical protein